MTMPHILRESRLRTLFALLACVTASLGCRTGSSDILATSSTLIGIDISQSASSEAPKIKLGYAREELAIVPTNRRNSSGSNSTNALEVNYRGGARESANVLMELHGAGALESLTFGAEVYQRLAVGEVAVSQTPAALLMARKADGTLDSNSVQAITMARETIRSDRTAAEDNFIAIENLLSAKAVDNPSTDAIWKVAKETVVNDVTFLSPDDGDPETRQDKINLILRRSMAESAKRQAVVREFLRRLQTLPQTPQN